MSRRIVAEAAAVVGRRWRITRREMADILARLADLGLDLDNGWQGRRPDGDHAAAWTEMCCGIRVVSVIAAEDGLLARRGSSNPGDIRYDDPGAMHPLLRAALMFAPATLAELPYDQIGQLRRKADRVFLVR